MLPGLILLPPVFSIFSSKRKSKGKRRNSEISELVHSCKRSKHSSVDLCGICSSREREKEKKARKPEKRT